MINNTNLTTLEKDVMNAIRNSGYYDDGLDSVWSNCLIDSCKVCETEQLSGVVSSLTKKGLVEVINKETKDSCVRYTKNGLELTLTLKDNVKLYDKDALLEPITLSRDERSTIMYLLRAADISNLDTAVTASAVCEKLEALRG